MGPCTRLLLTATDDYLVGDTVGQSVGQKSNALFYLIHNERVLNSYNIMQLDERTVILTYTHCGMFTPLPNSLIPPYIVEKLKQGVITKLQNVQQVKISDYSIIRCFSETTNDTKTSNNLLWTRAKFMTIIVCTIQTLNCTHIISECPKVTVVLLLLSTKSGT